MSELEQRLGAALGADAPPARDALFRLEVLVRRERARFKRQLGRALAAVFAAAVLVGLNAQTFGAWIGADPVRLVVVAALAAGAALAALPRVRAFTRRLDGWFFA
jgi:hypothetical protein